MEHAGQESYDLTREARNLARWLVEQVRTGHLSDDFVVTWLPGGGTIAGFHQDHPDISVKSLDALTRAQLMMSAPDLRPFMSRDGTTYEISRRCTLTAAMYEAVDTDFGTAQASPPKAAVASPEPAHADTPIAVPSWESLNMDAEMKERCLPLLAAADKHPMMWDSAVRTALVILEDRLRRVADTADGTLEGHSLADVAFGDRGALVGRFSSDAQRRAYRDLYAGMIGLMETTYAHRLVDPSPQRAWAILAFVNLLLSMLENLN